MKSSKGIFSNSEIFKININELLFDMVTFLFISFVYIFFPDKHGFTKAFPPWLFVTLVLLCEFLIVNQMIEVYKAYVEARVSSFKQKLIMAIFIMLVFSMEIFLPPAAYNNGIVDQTWMMVLIVGAIFTMLGGLIGERIIVTLLIMILVTFVILVVYFSALFFEHYFSGGLTFLFSFIVFLIVSIGVAGLSLIDYKRINSTYKRYCTYQANHEYTPVKLFQIVFMALVIAFLNDLFVNMGGAKYGKMLFFSMILSGFLPFRMVLLLKPQVRLLNIISCILLLLSYIFANIHGI